MKFTAILSLLSTLTLPALSQSTFTGQCGSDGHVRLDWTTAETNHALFAVQQSIDGNSWFTIGTIKEDDSSASAARYSYTINSETGPVSYFRLERTTAIGHASVTKSIVVNSCALAVSALGLDPNPVNGSALTGRIDIAPGETLTIEVVNATGHTITRGTIRQPEFRVELPGALAAGLYFARIASPVTTTVTPFLVK